MSDDEHVVVSKRDHVYTVTLNRPGRRNALDAHAQTELAAVFDEFENDADGWVAIITGAGDRAFCAGNDLKATSSALRTGGSPVDKNRRFGAITRRYECPKPLIAAVNGDAVGGGFEIVLACDIAVMAEEARLGLPEPRVGMIAAGGGIHRLSRQIATKPAMGMLLTGRLISADEALRFGLVNEVVPQEDVMEAATRWAGSILECSPLMVRLTKDAARRGAQHTLDDAIDADWEERIPEMLASQDHREGPAAFVEKRCPRWTGR